MDMSGMFWGATNFNQPLDKWDTSSVTNMEAMFWGAESFNQNLSAWGDKLGKVQNMKKNVSIHSLKHRLYQLVENP